MSSAFCVIDNYLIVEETKMSMTHILVIKESRAFLWIQHDHMFFLAFQVMNLDFIDLFYTLCSKSLLYFYSRGTVKIS